MSATIGNLNEISKFLNAESFTEDFRPVELTEYVKCGNSVYRVDWTEEENLVPVRTLLSPIPGTITRESRYFYVNTAGYVHPYMARSPLLLWY